MEQSLFAGTLVATMQRQGSAQTHWRECVLVAPSRETALGTLWEWCKETYPQSQGYTGHSVSVFLVPDAIVLEGARYAAQRQDRTVDGAEVEE